MNYSQITDKLFIGTTPLPDDYSTLRDLDVELVINMRIERRPHPDRHASPMRVLWLPTFDSPVMPIPLNLLHRGAKAALQTIEEDGKVYVHCAEGRHRGVAMGAAILIAQGNSPEEAMRLIKERREKADPEAWYIKRQILRFARTWDHHPKSEKPDRG